MRCLDLFAGGGGAALGLRAAGARCLAHVEIDPSACATLRAAVAAGLIEGEVIEGDVRAVDWAPCTGVDLVWASPPCQAWSSAGRRLGAQDERNGWPWTWDAVDQIRPKWLICENVGGLLHHLSAGHPERPQPVTQVGLFGAPPEPVMVRDDTQNPDGCSRCYWDHVILPEARRRFAYVDWRLIDCADLGVPQHRERLILVCGPEPYRWPVPTHRDPKLVHAAGKPWVTVRQALGISVEGIATAHGPGERVADRARVDLTDSPAWTVPSQPGSGGGAMMARARERHPDATPDAPAGTVRSGGSGHSAPPMWLRTELHAEDPGIRRAGDLLDQPAPTVAAGNGCGQWGGGGAVRRKWDAGAILPPLPGSEPELLDEPSPAVLASEVKGYSGGGSHNGRGNAPNRASDMLWRAAGRRRLTTGECAALQSFPPDYPWQGTKTAIYAQIGNACPPPLVATIVGQIMVSE